MTQKECETKLLELAEEMERVYKTFDPTGKKLYITISDGRINIEDDRYIESLEDGKKYGIKIFRSSKGEVARSFFLDMIFKRGTIL